MNINPYRVIPTLPETLSPLLNLSYNIWYAWNSSGLRLFQHMDRDLWEKVGHNPVEMLSSLSQGRILELMEDAGFLSQMGRVWESFTDYISEKGAYSFLLSRPLDFRVAYFSMEFGLTESLPIYSGGLGILAGDHLKSASDLSLPLTGVGLMYKNGYFSQYLSNDGWQQEEFPDNDFYHMPLTLVRDEHSRPIMIAVDLMGRQCKAQIWKCQVGRVSLYLLDSNIEENAPAERRVTSSLYAGNMEDRLRQEILLGIGGVRALQAIGEDPVVYHMNEGHSFLVALERIRMLMENHGLDMDTARTVVNASLVFTTHTPVPAGNDVFDPGLMERYLGKEVKGIGIEWQAFFEMGRISPEDSNEPFGATVFALKNSAFRNGVSRLHGEVSRQMWKGVWPEAGLDDVPISRVTNGIHIPSWISSDLAGLFDRYIGPKWKEDPDNQKVWERIDVIPDNEIWFAHQRRRERLVSFARQRLVEQVRARGGKQRDIDRAGEVLHSEALTIGFAKRFASYKRGGLIFSDIERLRAILLDDKRPVQLIISGKAHPRDNDGKAIIQKMIHITRDDPFRDRVVFLEDYNINIARYLVQGVDVWLNTPRRPLEACGTSGMKSTANGALNLSVLDGWWVEGYNPELGWAIGSGETYANQDYQDEVEGRAIYDLLEREIIPLFYERGLDGLPRGWISMMKKSMRSLCPVFNSNRMVQEYTDRCYMEAAMVHRSLVENNFHAAGEFVEWAKRIRKAWPGVKILDMLHKQGDEVKVHADMVVNATVMLGDLEPSDITCSIYYGHLDEAGCIQDAKEIEMQHVSRKDRQAYLFEGNIDCEDTGRFGYTVRVLPRHEYCRHPVDLGLVCWA
ncbi:MAG: alpha-glucan family phosphorylase [Thermodesulfobacteriota bacterium]|nr:alpha-glucan family phosphorylase [Thermodesulfobacteriota bacterium]